MDKYVIVIQKGPKMVSIYEILNEMPVAIKGNYEDPSKIKDLSIYEYENNWDFRGTIASRDNIEYAVIQSKNTAYMVWEAGLITNDKVEIVFHIELYKNAKLGASLGYSELYHVGTVTVRNDVRGRRIATEMYRFLIKKANIKIVGCISVCH